jgi:hypothetical protein
VSSGYVYVLSNESMLGYVKVGRSIHGGAARSIALYRTGVATPFKLEFELFTPDHEWLESQAHMNLKFNRVSPDREFFRCTPDDAIEEILAIYSERLFRNKDAQEIANDSAYVDEPVLSEAELQAQADARKAMAIEGLQRIKAMFENV